MTNLKDIKSKVENLSVLIIDDEEEIRDVNSRFMKKLFAKVDTAKDGKEGLQKFKDNSYDIIFTDIKMPLMDGWELINKIREINKEIFIVAMTASRKFEKELSHLSNMYILKPIEIDIMKDILFKIIKEKKL
ncbi:response regulator [Sulfurospirillum arcachonense]|uniref:response regulator n=1 Tax=Sulfurospirillum arcachonense TaxID=57666 RepID=UPI00046850DC|nr:response regulator [Sulfurospirillum arcachonense]